MYLGKELPCKYISYSFEWADSLEVKVVGQLKELTGLDCIESRWLKRLSDLGISKFRQCNAIVRVKYCNSLQCSLVKGANRLRLI